MGRWHHWTVPLILLSLLSLAIGYDPSPLTINTCGGCCGVGSNAIEHRLEFIEDLITKGMKVIESRFGQMNPHVIRGKRNKLKLELSNVGYTRTWGGQILYRSLTMFSI